MQIKFPTYSPERFFCGLARPCNITGIEGEGLGNNDRVARTMSKANRLTLR